MVSDEPPAPETPDEEIAQDPGIPGGPPTDEEVTPTTDDRHVGAAQRERPDDSDEEGHQTAGEPPRPS
jgi:hypothetical protein